MNKDEDRNIKGVFEHLRIEEERQAPSFYEILQERESGKFEPRSWFGHWLQPVAVMLLLVLIAVPIIYNYLQDSVMVETEIASDFEEWESPADFLLSFNDEPYLSGLPEIGSSFWETE
ncbi:MAG: hypothetical protein ABIJ42_10605 [Acidobacteriota bacterium]